MLTHRTNVLLSQQDYEHLSKLARQHGKSRGHLLRNAFKQTYSTKNTETKKQLHPLEEMRKIARDANFQATTKEILSWKHEGHKI